MNGMIQITSPLFPNRTFIFNTQENTFVEEYKECVTETKDDASKKEPKLKKDGTPKNIKCNKKKGRKCEVFSFSIEDASKILNYFADRNEWLHYMLFVLSCNMARRNGDMRNLTWENFFNPKTGKFRQDLLEIKEEKTDKIANPHINSAVRAAIEIYLEKTNCDPAQANYTIPICMQLSGTHKGEILSYDGCRKAIKRAASAVGVEYNVATHSGRKTFGSMSRMLHPGDYDSMELLQTIYNHSDAKTTKRYIGLTKEKTDAYFDDMGNFFDDYVTGDKTYEDVANTPIVSLDANDLREIVTVAYKAGQDNASETDAMIHIEAINKIMAMIENLSK